MTEEYSNLVIQALLTIANSDSIKQILEPNVAEPMELKEWMVRRTLLALKLFEDEYDRQTNKSTTKL